jgi:hypothetical protein
MNVQKIRFLTAAYQYLGLSRDAAFERAFSEYQAIKKGGAA